MFLISFEICARCPLIWDTRRKNRGKCFRCPIIGDIGDTWASKPIASGRVGAERLALRRLLQAAGYPPDYTDVKYECPLCSDVGCTTDGKMCACMKKKLILAGMESSGAAELMKTQSFETFDLS